VEKYLVAVSRGGVTRIRSSSLMTRTLPGPTLLTTWVAC